jgi:hypothetical protein
MYFRVRFEKTLEPPALFVCVERLMLKHYYDNFVLRNFSIHWFYTKKKLTALRQNINFYE